MRAPFTVALGVALLGLFGNVREGRAHQASVVYSTLIVEGPTVHYSIQLSAADLAVLLGGERTASAELAEQAQLFAVLQRNIAVTTHGTPCALQAKRLSFPKEKSMTIAELTYQCQGQGQGRQHPPASLAVHYDLFFDLDPNHQGLVRVLLAGQPPRELVFHRNSRDLRLEQSTSLLKYVGDYLRLGIEHILTGYDHLAFLFGLLLAVGMADLRARLRTVLGIVTAFTVAHSLTLLAAGLGWVQLSPRLVEPAIALSIVYVAVENLAVARPRFRWLLAFAFGLVHGFGFAGALQEVGLPVRRLIWSLLAFNLGVEVGQLGIVLLFGPALYFFARLLAQVFANPQRSYDRLTQIGGSALLGALGTWWFFERTLEQSWR